jgi:hypothetical protein
LVGGGGVVGAGSAGGLHPNKLCGISKLQVDDSVRSNSPSA